MNRTLRALALVAFLGLIGFFLLSRLPFQNSTIVSGTPDALGLLLPMLPALLVNLVGQTTFALCLVVGVIALVACFQRRQRQWIVGFVVLLLVTANGSYLILELTPTLSGGQTWAYTYAPIMALFPTALLPLAVLIYTVSPHQRAVQSAQPIQPTSVVD